MQDTTTTEIRLTDPANPVDDGKRSWASSLREIVGPKPTPGDIATALIAGPIGFVADGFLTIHGAPSPGIAGAMTASVALGVKRAVWPARRSRRRAVNAARNYAHVLRRLMDDQELQREDKRHVQALVNRLTMQSELCERRVITPARMYSEVDALLEEMKSFKYLKW